MLLMIRQRRCYPSVAAAVAADDAADLIPGERRWENTIDNTIAMPRSRKVCDGQPPHSGELHVCDTYCCRLQ